MMCPRIIAFGFSFNRFNDAIDLGKYLMLNVATTLALGTSLVSGSAIAQAASGTYRPVLTRDANVCGQVEKAINAAAGSRPLPFLYRDRAPFSSVDWRAVQTQSRGTHGPLPLLVSDLDWDGKTEAVAARSTVSPNGTFDVTLDLMPASVAERAEPIDARDMVAATVATIRSGRIKLSALRKRYPAGAFGHVRLDIPVAEADGSETTLVNAFDLLAVGGRPYLFMQTYDVDESGRVARVRQWSVVARLKNIQLQKDSPFRSVDLDASLEHVCYFVFSTR